MNKNSQDFSIQQAKRLAKTPEGQKLMAMLQQKDDTTLQKAMAEASAGNFKEAGSILQSLLSSPEAQQLIRRMEADHG